MDNILIPIILGTAREGRESERVAKAIYEILSERDEFLVQLIDVRNYIHGHTIPPWEENNITRSWKDIVKKASAFLIVTPEYNHGYPGELKMLLDQELKAYNGKPVVVCGVSAGSFGGTRVIENLLPTLRELGMLISSYSIYVSNVTEFQPDDKFRERVNKAADKLNRYLNLSKPYPPR